MWPHSGGRLWRGGAAARRCDPACRGPPARPDPALRACRRVAPAPPARSRVGAAIGRLLATEFRVRRVTPNTKNPHSRRRETEFLWSWGRLMHSPEQHVERATAAVARLGR